jgi:hypothetical protein
MVDWVTVVAVAAIVSAVITLSIRWLDRPRAVLRLEAGAKASGVKGHGELPSSGHENCPLVATRSARSWPSDVPWGGSSQGVHPLAGHGLGEPDAIAAGLADVGVVQEPVDGGGGQCFGHQLVESCRVEIAR